MILKVKPGRLQSTIALPGSKSYANRILILAALKETPFLINRLPDSDDVTFLVKALGVVGLSIVRTENTLTIQNSFPQCETEGKTIEVGEGGTTARFLASLLLRGSKSYCLVLGDKLKTRPWEEFIHLVEQHGGKAKLNDNKLTVQGPLTLPDRVEVDCSRTTQFASGLQLAFSLSGKVIVPSKLNTSQSYWKMTEELVHLARKQNSYDVPLDWSSASYPLAFGALTQNITFPGLSFDPFQADAKFMEILKAFEAIEIGPHGLMVKPCQKNASIHVDVSDCLDLVPALAFLLAHRKGEHKLKGVANLIHKESDRLLEVTRLLSRFKRKTSVSDNVLTIHGSEEILTEAIELDLPDDHRMVMTGVLFLLKHAGGSVSPAQAVNKSYPGFFNILNPS